MNRRQFFSMVAGVVAFPATLFGKRQEQKKGTNSPYNGMCKTINVPEYTLPGGRSRWFKHLFKYGKDEFDECTTKEILESGLYGHLWTADIHISRAIEIDYPNWKKKYPLLASALKEGRVDHDYVRSTLDRNRQRMKEHSKDYEAAYRSRLYDSYNELENIGYPACWREDYPLLAQAYDQKLFTCQQVRDQLRKNYEKKFGPAPETEKSKMWFSPIHTPQDWQIRDEL